MKKIILMSIFLIVGININVQTNDWGLPGTYLNWGAGARSFGMGKAYVGLADDASAVYWNPAGLITLTTPEVVLLHTSLFENTHYNFVSFGYPLSYWSCLGIAAVVLSTQDIEKRTEGNELIGKFSNIEAALLLSYGYRYIFIKNLSLGGTLKVVKQQISNYNDISIGADVGLLYSIGKVRMGIKVQNLIPPAIKLYREVETFPLGIRAGLGIKLLENKLILTADVMKQIHQDVKFYSGIECSPLENLSLRAGVDETEITVGIGFKYKKFAFDYAIALQTLGYSHRFSVNLKFGRFITKIKPEAKTFRK